MLLRCALASSQPIVVEGARRCTRVVRCADDEEEEEREGELRDCRISHCRDARVYVLAPTRHLTIVGCVDCLIVVGAVARLSLVVA